MKAMFKNLVYAALVLIGTSLQAQEKFTVKGKMSHLRDGTVLNLMYQQNRKLVMDSAVVNGGKFSFTGEITEPVKARVMVSQLRMHMGTHFSQGKAAKTEDAPAGDTALATVSGDAGKNDGSPGSTVVVTGKFSSDNIDAVKKGSVKESEAVAPKPMQMPDFVEFFLEKGTLSITGKDSLGTATVKGGSTQRDFADYNAQVNAVNRKLGELMMQVQEGESQGKDVSRIKDQLKDAENELYAINKSFVGKHPDSYVSLGIVQSVSFVIDPETYEPLYNSLSSRLKESTKGKIFAEKLALAKQLTIGKPAKEINQNNPEGAPVPLSSFRGKYVLIDFWASWCGPCRAENPNVLKAYHQFKDKGLEIYAVSLDDKKDLWIEAIKHDGLPWVHVSDLKGWKNQAATDYGVSGVPQNYLIDPNGIIIASNLRGDELSEKLAELIK